MIRRPPRSTRSEFYSPTINQPTNQPSSSNGVPIVFILPLVHQIHFLQCGKSFASRYTKSKAFSKMMDANDDDLDSPFSMAPVGGDQYIIHEEDGSEESGSDNADRPGYVLREQDRFLPIANVARIMKRTIPKTGKIAKDARECVQECISEFISFITSEASDRCHQEKRKTINGEDILFAMSTLGFDNYVDPLKLYLSKYRDSIKGDKSLSDAFEEVNDENYSSSASLGAAGTAVAVNNGTIGVITQDQQGGSQQTVLFTYPSGQITQFQLT
uniref:EOG090X0DUU n=1 Tax=Lynceus sp. MCZ IZ 141354 TaxID=1930659 RepID=A0A9N6ZG76_9CRUS|nr:EOG090X0DUU [Lynceus sp. MCZ IZ 141354]